VWPPREDSHLVLLKNLPKQLLNLRFGCSELVTTDYGRPIYSPDSPTYLLWPGLQQPASLQPVKNGIQRARAEPVSVPGKLFNDPEAKDFLLAGVVKNVQPDQAGIKPRVAQSKPPLSDSVIAYRYYTGLALLSTTVLRHSIEPSRRAPLRRDRICAFRGMAERHQR
jgi:hypothetical protein